MLTNVSFDLYSLGAYVCDYFSGTQLCQEYLLPFNQLSLPSPVRGIGTGPADPASARIKFPVQL